MVLTQLCNQLITYIHRKIGNCYDCLGRHKCRRKSNKRVPFGTLFGFLGSSHDLEARGDQLKLENLPLGECGLRGRQLESHRVGACTADNLPMRQGRLGQELGVDVFLKGGACGLE
jgi:hypothetical protein